MSSRSREIVWRDEPPDGPEPLPLEWEAFWRARSLSPTPPQGDIGVFVRRGALEEARDHARMSPGAEVGGILYGRVYQNPALTAVDVVAAVPAHEADGTPVHLSFTSQAWEHVFRRRAEIEEDLEVVGWYHSHPGLGVFLSGTDRKTHAAFFPQPWHLALVLDPVSGDEGMFTGGGERVAVGEYDRMAPVLPETANGSPVAPSGQGAHDAPREREAAGAGEPRGPGGPPGAGGETGASSGGVFEAGLAGKAALASGSRAEIGWWFLGAAGVAVAGLALLGVAFRLGRKLR